MGAIAPAQPVSAAPPIEEITREGKNARRCAGDGHAPGTPCDYGSRCRVTNPVTTPAEMNTRPNSSHGLLASPIVIS